MDQAPNFAESYPIKALLDIAKRHIDDVDQARVTDRHVIGQDNWDKLYVSTVFSAIAVEAAVNDFLQAHCLLLQQTYLQELFGGVMKSFLFASIHRKLDLLVASLPDRFPLDVLKEVRELIRIRNRITHQVGEFIPCENGEAILHGHRVSSEEHIHMLRHWEIANGFLKLFWHAGTAELHRGMSDAGSDQGNAQS